MSHSGRESPPTPSHGGTYGLEIEPAEGDLLVSEAEGDQVTPLRAVVLRGEQGFGKKTFRATIAAGDVGVAPLPPRPSPFAPPRRG
jgi:hypothetical protein